MSSDPRTPNVNVPLEKPESRPNRMAGRGFPCPVCAVNLPIRIARTQKPYCVWHGLRNSDFLSWQSGDCAFAGDSGRQYIGCGIVVRCEHPRAFVFNRIQHLKQRKSELERKQRLIFPDPDLENAIRAVDKEIARVQGELAKSAGERTER